MEDKNKVALIIILFTIMFTLAIRPIILNGWDGTDAHRHQVKALGCEYWQESKWTKEACETYSPLLAAISRPFAENSERYLMAMFLLIGILIPIALYKTTESWTGALFYFTTTSFFYYHIDGIYAQALAYLLAIGLITTKSWKIEIGIATAMLLAHGHGFILAAVILLAKYTPTTGFLGCSGTFGKRTPEILEQPVNNVGGYGITVANYIHPFIRIVPIPFLAIAIWQLIKERKTWLVILTAMLLIATFTISVRVVYFATIPMIIGLTDFYKRTKWKKPLIAGAILMGVYNLYAYINLKVCLANI